MNEIDHDGVVEDIKGNNLIVRIVTRSACASCQVKNLCNPSEMQEKVFEVLVSNPDTFSKGDCVKMAITEGMGFLAVFMGYIIPLILLLTGVIVATNIGFNELVSAGMAIGLLGVYYMILYFTRKKTMKSFTFKVTRI